MSEEPEIEFLLIDDVLAIHADLIERYGGALGLRDRQLLESAIAQPRAAFGGQNLHEDEFAMAAAYAFHLVMNHPFLDGNKRVGYAAAETFLVMNGYETTCGDDEAYDTVIAVATGSMPKAELAAWFRANARRAEQRE